ncbi:NACHT domain-containing protein [Streptomyces griseoluteus]|uniref:NACHT domain-containing protein n=1 Tax=Streptomyces griseoluteus TaxID=29306 RepID=A0A4Z1CYN4_STRGP|nr:NACHT domain-containing protein [Streptomyces griseoluteus]TGN74087.1 NACHT domain-containing protein [Streptomyces griseoluteus]GHF07946.1 hypothetical protein GCM10017776_26720 [Streptomyces griseoluteus]
MPVAEIVTAAFGIAGKVAAKPAADAALRKELIVKALKKLHLDPHVPPQDFDTLYAYTLIEYGVGCSVSVPALFRDEYVIEAFRRSFEAGDWDLLRAEVANAVERGRQTAEFGHLDHNFAETHVDGFVTAFQGLVDRSRAPHETRMERKLDELLERVSHTRDEEENHRARTEPGRADLSPAARLMRDVSDWFVAVGYEIRRTWETGHDTVALLVDVPQRRPGRFDRTVMLCVEGELAPHHVNLLDQLVTDEGAREGWGLAQMRVSKAARQRAEGSGDRLFCYTFDELVELEADFEPYIAWVEQEVRRRGIDTRYVPLSCQKDEIDPATQQPLDTSVYDWREGGLDDYVAGWLEDPAKKHLSLLGEFGMGKSWFALHLAGEMARGWQDARRKGLPRPRIPLLIPLRDYAKQTSVEALLSEFFFNKHKINLRSYDVFRVLNRMSRLLLIFDGFDEMAARVDYNTVVANFWELARAVEPGAKVLLSSRTEHFPDARVARDLFGAKASASVRKEEGPTFEIVELVPFDDEQIELMLGHVLTEDKVRMVMGHDEVRKLMKRPLMSELVIDALPEIERGAEIDLARIYMYAIQRKMDRDIKEERTFTSRADKLYFLCEFAWEMLSSNRLTLNYRDFPSRLKAWFGGAVRSSKDLDYWEQDMRNQSMLVRNAEGDYGPSHKSLLEFLVAFKFAAELGLLSGDFLDLIPGSGNADGESYTWSQYFEGRSQNGLLPPLATFVPEPLHALALNFGALEPNTVVYQFLAAMVRLHPDFHGRLLEVMRQTRGHEPLSGVLAGNCANLVLAAGGTLAGEDLSGLCLSGFTPTIFASGAPLTGTVLRNCDLIQVPLAGVDLTGADLTGASFGPGVLEDAMVWRGGLVHDRGSVVMGASAETWCWPDGNVAGRRLVFPGRPDTEDVFGCDLVLWDEEKWALLSGSDWLLVDAGTGEVTGSVKHARLPVWWRGRAVTCDWDWAQLTIIDPLSQEVIDTVPVPDSEPSDSSETVFQPGRGGVSLLRINTRGVRHQICDQPGPQAWRTVTEAKIDLSEGWRSAGTDEECWIKGDKLFAASDGYATYVALSAEGVSLPGPLLGAGPTFTFRAESGMAALATTIGVHAWRLVEDGVLRNWEDASARWQLPSIPGGVSALWSSPAGDRLVVLHTMGELTVHDFRTGEILSRNMLTTRLKGTRFSRGCGFDEPTLDAITRAGGVVVD